MKYILPPDFEEIRYLFSRLSFHEEAYETGRKMADVFIANMVRQQNAFLYSTVTHLTPHNNLGRIKEVGHGLKRYLGYEEESFDLVKSLAIMEPVYALIMFEYAKWVYGRLVDENFRRSIASGVSYTFPLLVINGKTGAQVPVIRHSKILFDQERRMLPFQVNTVYIVVREYPEEMWRPVPRPKIDHKMEGFFDQELQRARLQVMSNVRKRIVRIDGVSALPSAGQIEVLKLMSEGMQAKEVAKQLGRSLPAVRGDAREIKSRLSHLFSFNFQSAEEAARFVMAVGLFDTPVQHALGK